MAKEINETQLFKLLANVRWLINPDESAQGAPIQNTGKTKQGQRDIGIPQPAGIQQRLGDEEFDSVLTMIRAGNFSGALDKLNEEIDNRRDCPR